MADRHYSDMINYHVGKLAQVRVACGDDTKGRLVTNLARNVTCAKCREWLRNPPAESDVMPPAVNPWLGRAPGEGPSPPPEKAAPLSPVLGTTLPPPPKRVEPAAPAPAPSVEQPAPPVGEVKHE